MLFMQDPREDSLEQRTNPLVGEGRYHDRQCPLGEVWSNFCGQLSP